MTSPTAVFSSIAHEAWDHKVSDGENDDSGHNASQRSRRRYGVSKIISFTSAEIIFITIK
jgi:hypothetical protein